MTPDVEQIIEQLQASLDGLSLYWLAADNDGPEQWMATGYIEGQLRIHVFSPTLRGVLDAIETEIDRHEFPEEET